jgi:polysaccharide biosynthesis protein PslH
MNILFLSPEIPYPPHGGHHLRTLNVLKILAREHHIHFIGFAQNRRDFHYIPELRAQCESVDLFEIAKTGYNPAFFLAALKNAACRFPLVAQRYFIPAAQQRLERIMLQHKIDLVHIDMLALGLYRFLVPQVPVFLTNHNVESVRLYRWLEVEKNPALRLYLGYQYRKLRQFEKEICPAMDRCIAVSKTDCEYLHKLCGSENFSVVPNGVDISYFEPQPVALRPNHLIWVGGMGSPYNADAVNFFLEAIWPVIKRMNPKATVEFIGESPTALLQRLAARDPQIQVTGLVNDIRPSVSAAAVFIAPIRSGSGTKIKVLNAMAQAKAVVATSIAAEGIELVDGEHASIADDPQSFADRVCELLSERERAHRMGQAARGLVEQIYDWEVIGRNMLKLYAA